MLYLSRYLPQPMSDEELEIAVREVLAEEGITEIKLMGFAIKKCKDKFGNRTTGKQLSDMVKRLITEINEV